MSSPRDKLSGTGGDLFKDLRDRRLLPVVALLVVAIIAVPLLLGGGGGDQPPEPVPLSAAATAGGEQLDPVVVPAEHGIRDFRERVDSRPRNPFKQQYPGMKEASSDQDPSTAAGGQGTPTSEPPSGSPLVGGDSTPPVTEPASPPPEDEPKQVTKLIRMTIDVRISHDGKKREIDGVEPLSPLPGGERPITRYIGADREAERAAFVLSPAVTATEGDGNCDPGRNDCQFLTLKPGESQYFRYGERAKRYRLKLVAINREVVKRTVDGGEDGDGDGDGEGDSGASASEVG